MGLETEQTRERGNSNQSNITVSTKLSMFWFFNILFLTKRLLVSLTSGSQLVLESPNSHQPVVDSSCLGVSERDQPKENGWKWLLYPCFWSGALDFGGNLTDSLTCSHVTG